MPTVRRRYSIRHPDRDHQPGRGQPRYGRKRDRISLESSDLAGGWFPRSQLALRGQKLSTVTNPSILLTSSSPKRPSIFL